MSNETYQQFFESNKSDKNGRKTGYIVMISEREKIQARVQKGIKTSEGFETFGAGQNWTTFANLANAKKWAYKIANERIERLNK